MKLLVIALFASVLAVQARVVYIPFYVDDNNGAGYGGSGYGTGGYGGNGYGIVRYADGGYGNGYGSSGYEGGSEFDGSSYYGGENGYLDQGYGLDCVQETYDTGHVEDNFDSTVHHHQSGDHDIGGISQGSQGGHLKSGHSSYQKGQNNYGRDYKHGYNHVKT